MSGPSWAIELALVSLVVAVLAVVLLLPALLALDRDPSPVAVRPHARRG